jgi:hypothetical protein
MNEKPKVVSLAEARARKHGMSVENPASVPKQAPQSPEAYALGSDERLGLIERLTHLQNQLTEALNPPAGKRKLSAGETQTLNEKLTRVSTYVTAALGATRIDKIFATEIESEVDESLNMLGEIASDAGPDGEY